MPEFSLIHIALLVLTTLLGVVVGWLVRGNRTTQEKAAINAGWQEQIDAQRTEHSRLVDQNKGLMDQVSQFQASNRDAKNRARELSSAVQEAYARRDELQREIKDIRNNLEVAVTQRDKLRTDVAAQSEERLALQQKDEKIFQLSRELENWQNRLPPLIERFRVRDEEALQLEAELRDARQHIEQLESARDEGETRIEPVRHPDSLTNGRDASNDSIDLNTDDSAEVVIDGGASANDLNMLRDNLQQIKGIGPAIERTLNEMGIYRFQQIADMSEYDIDRVAQRLKGFHSRIYREDWIGQAREFGARNRSD